MYIFNINQVRPAAAKRLTFRGSADTVFPAHLKQTLSTLGSDRHAPVRPSDTLPPGLEGWLHHGLRPGTGRDRAATVF